MGAEGKIKQHKNSPRVMLMLMSVLSTILVNSSKLIFDDLLQLHVLQVAADHHLEHDEQLAVADVTVAVDVVHLEREAQLLLLVTLAAEGAQPADEFLEVDVAAAVLVEDGDHSVGM